MTACTFNPHTDLQVSMTAAAIAHVQQLFPDRCPIPLRLSIKTSGCSGFKYQIDPIDNPTEPDDIALSMQNQVTLYVAPAAVPFVQGIEIDLVQEGINQTLKFNNPNAKDVCGCGESFSLDSA